MTKTEQTLTYRNEEEGNLGEAFDELQVQMGRAILRGHGTKGAFQVEVLHPKTKELQTLSVFFSVVAGAMTDG